jgi:hypothetical protein
MAGIVDELELVSLINRQIGEAPREQMSAGVIVKAMLLNGLGFVSALLCLFERCFVGKATEHDPPCRELTDTDPMYGLLH